MTHICDPETKQQPFQCKDLARKSPSIKEQHHNLSDLFSQTSWIIHKQFIPPCTITIWLLLGEFYCIVLRRLSALWEGNIQIKWHMNNWVFYHNNVKLYTLFIVPHLHIPLIFGKNNVIFVHWFHPAWLLTTFFFSQSWKLCWNGKSLTH